MALLSIKNGEYAFLIRLDLMFSSHYENNFYCCES